MTVDTITPDFQIGPILNFLNLSSIALFAATGALAAARHHQTIVTFAFFGLITGLGGGTVRDIIIDAPVFWIRDNQMALIALLSALGVWFIPRHWWHENVLVSLDAAGLATYAVYGAARALDFGVDPAPAVFMGVVTASAGGIIRDLIVGQRSIMLGSELYISAGILASAAFVLLDMAGLSTPIAAIIASASGFLLRGAAIRYDLSLPSYRGYADTMLPDDQDDSPKA